MNAPNTEQRVLILVIVMIAAVLALTANLGFMPVTFLPDALDLPAVTRHLMPLFVTSTFIERAVEVILTTWRAKGAGEIANAMDQAEEVGNMAAKQAQERELTAYRSVSQRLAFKVALAIGVVFSALGVRALGAFVDPVQFRQLPASQQTWFGLGDVLLSGLVLGGGSDGIHKLVSVVTNFLDSLSIKAKEIGTPPAAPAPSAGAAPTGATTPAPGPR